MTTSVEESQPKTTRRRASAAKSAKPTSTRRSTKKKKVATSEPTQDQIAERAWHIWNEQGCPDGCAEQNWLQAESELRAGH